MEAFLSRSGLTDIRDATTKSQADEHFLSSRDTMTRILPTGSALTSARAPSTSLLSTQENATAAMIWIQRLYL